MNAIPYLTIALTLFIAYLCECKKIKCKISINVLEQIVFVLLLIFIGLRGHIYSDFVSYYPFYNNLPNIFNIKGSLWDIEYFEPGYIIYSSIFKSIVPDYFCWVFINTLIDLLIFRYIFKQYTQSKILPYIFFFAFNGLFVEFNLYRNVKSIELFLLSIPYLEKHRFTPYLLINVLGLIFHSSSIVYIPLYFILTKEIPKTVKWGGIILANVIFLFKINIISDLINSLNLFQGMTFMNKLSGHFEHSEASQTISIGYIERLFSIITFTLLYEKLANQRRCNIIFYNCFWIYYISFLTFYEVQTLVDRIPTLFIFSYWILYPNILTLKYTQRKFVYAVSILLVFLKVYTANIGPTAEYENIVWGTDNYEIRKEIVLRNLE